MTYTCLGFLESGDVVVGDSEGNINSYSVSAEGDYYRSGSIPAHTRGVASILVMSQGTLLSCGEKDRKITAWDTNRDFVMLGKKLQHTKVFRNNSSLTSRKAFKKC